MARAGLRNPAVVAVKVRNVATKRSQAIPTSLNNTYVMCNADEKLAQLVHFCNTHHKEKIIVFFLTCASVDYFAKVWPLCCCCCWFLCSPNHA